MKNYKIFFKWLTFICCTVWLTITTTYGALIIGTYVHENMHVTTSLNASVMEVHYDTSGVTKGGDINHNNELHKWIYFNNNIVTLSMVVVTTMCILILMVFPLTLYISYNKK